MKSFHTFLISTPRSNSVCITRILEQTKRFNILHEPYVSVYDKEHYSELTKSWWKDTAFNESKDIIASIKTIEQNNKSALIKDMAFAITNYIDHIPKNDNFKYILLCRNPLDVLISFYKKTQQFEDNTSLNIDDWRSLSGFYQLLELKKKLSNNKNILVLSSDDIMKCIEQIFKFLNIEFKQEYTKWSPCINEEEISSKSSEWKENKNNVLFSHWHKEALQSNGLLLNNKKHHIEEIEDIKNRDMVIKLSEELLPVYNELLSL